MSIVNYINGFILDNYCHVSCQTYYYYHMEYGFFVSDIIKFVNTHKFLQHYPTLDWKSPYIRCDAIIRDLRLTIISLFQRTKNIRNYFRQTYINCCYDGDVLLDRKYLINSVHDNYFSGAFPLRYILSSLYINYSSFDYGHQDLIRSEIVKWFANYIFNTFIKKN